MKSWSTSRFGEIARSPRGIYFLDHTIPFSPSRFYIVWKLRRRGFHHLTASRKIGGYWFKEGLSYHRAAKHTAKQREEGLEAGRLAYRTARGANPFNRCDEWTKHIAWEEGWNSEMHQQENRR